MNIMCKVGDYILKNQQYRQNKYPDKYQETQNIEN